jgi:hypothetical protein
MGVGRGVAVGGGGVLVGGAVAVDVGGTGADVALRGKVVAVPPASGPFDGSAVETDCSAAVPIVVAASGSEWARAQAASSAAPALRPSRATSSRRLTRHHNRVPHRKPTFQGCVSAAL